MNRQLKLKESFVLTLILLVVGQSTVLAQETCYELNEACYPALSDVNEAGVILDVTDEISQTVVMVRPGIPFTYTHFTDVYDYDRNKYTLIISGTNDVNNLQFGQPISLTGQLVDDNLVHANAITILTETVTIPFFISDAFVGNTTENSLTISSTQWLIGTQSLVTFNEPITLTLMFANDVFISSEEGRLEHQFIATGLFGTYSQDASTVHYIGNVMGDAGGPFNYAVTGEIVEIIRTGEIVVRTSDDNLVQLSYSRWVDITGIADELHVGLGVSASGSSSYCSAVGYYYTGYSDPYGEECYVEPHPYPSGVVPVGSIETFAWQTPLAVTSRTIAVSHHHPSSSLLIVATITLLSPILWSLCHGRIYNRA